MKIKALKLEKLRKRIESIALSIGRIGDYVDRFGFPEGDEYSEMNKLSDYHSEKTLKDEELKGLVYKYLEEEPDVIDLWTSWHKKACEEIIRMPDEKRDTEIRKRLAKETLNKLDELKKFKRYKFSINDFYLSDYYIILKSG